MAGSTLFRFGLQHLRTQVCNAHMDIPFSMAIYQNATWPLSVPVRHYAHPLLAYHYRVLILAAQSAAPITTQCIHLQLVSPPARSTSRLRLFLPVHQPHRLLQHQ
jgi:hypothetical protein